MSDPQSMIGKILPNEVTERDAIHIAITPMVAATRLAPGNHVGLVGDGAGFVDENPIGIVDPFLRHHVEIGQKFYVFLYPNTITGLRHHWEHPSFDDKERKIEESKKVIESFAKRMGHETYNYTYSGTKYEELMDAADQIANGEDYAICSWDSGAFEGYHLELSETEWHFFWRHYEVITGRKVEGRPHIRFSCSC